MTPRDQHVRERTARGIKAALDDQMRDRLFRDTALDEDEFLARMEALDREWDISRYVEIIAPVVALTGLGLSMRGSRTWLVLPTVALSLLVQHATQGWCPAVPLLRRAGIRTRREIEEERYALKALRGDFSGLPPDAPQNRVTRVDAALDAVRA